MTTLEQVREACDEFSNACPACENLNHTASAVVITLDGRLFFDGPYCPHFAEQVRERVAAIPGVTLATVQT